ncbi:MAG: MerR family transcriptional regulator [Pseudonocardiaceae bacterium]|nr:MerR family transcriptional regulator [Pseudonocardiaceae bacterium]
MRLDATLHGLTCWIVSKLVSTSVAAAELGVSVRTLQQWAHDGLVIPDLWTPGGHARWDVERLRRELRDKRQRDE